MVKRDLKFLDPMFVRVARTVKELYEERSRGDLLIYCTLRSFEEQARLFRRSRTLTSIKRKAQRLENAGYEELAQILIDVGPQKGQLGKHITNAGPGESWHQYGEAVDAVPMVGGKPLWDPNGREWQIYGEAIEDAGGYWAGRWPRFREYPHFQRRKSGNPLAILSKREILDAIELFRELKEIRPVP